MHDTCIGSIIVLYIIAQHIHGGSSTRVRISLKECVAKKIGVVPEMMIGGLRVYIIPIYSLGLILGLD